MNRESSKDGRSYLKWRIWLLIGACLLLLVILWATSRHNSQNETDESADTQMSDTSGSALPHAGQPSKHSADSPILRDSQEASSNKKRAALMTEPTSSLQEVAPLPSIAATPEERLKMLERNEKSRQLNARLESRIRQLQVERETASESRKNEIDKALILLNRNLEQRKRRYLPSAIPERSLESDSNGK